MLRPTAHGAVEIDDVQPAGTRIHPTPGHRHGVVGEHGFLLHATLTQTNAASPFQVNRGNEKHRLEFLEANVVAGGSEDRIRRLSHR